MRLAIVVGHESKARGAYGVPPLNQNEYDFNKEVAAVMFQYAKQAGIECQVFMRDNIGVSGAYEKVNAWGLGQDSLCIELHFNSFDGKVRGTEVLFDNEPDDSVSYAQEILQELCTLFHREGKQNRGIKLVTRTDNNPNNDRGAASLDGCKITSCLVEPFFGDNQMDAALGHAMKYRYAKSLVDASIRFATLRSNNLKRETNLFLS